MKPKTPYFLMLIAAAMTAGAPASFATALTWTGGDGNNWSTSANWGGSGVPASGDTLTFSGSNTTSVNDITGLTLGTTASSITFGSGAGAFEISGQALTLGGSSGGGYTVITQASANNQIISANLTLGGGGGDRSIVMSGAGSLTLSGNLNYSNSWLFPNTTAGTIVLSGNNSGDGKGAIVSGGTNQMRATIGNNVAGTQLVLGSDTALGNATSGDVGLGTAAFRGIQARQQTNISTVGNRDLSAYAIAINANNVTFNGAANMTIGHIINQGGNRDFVVSSTGRVSVSNGISLSHDQTGRSLYLNLSGAGGMVVDGKLYDTFHSGGLTSGSSTLRKAGAATLTLNGDSSNFSGSILVDAGTLKLGHGNALGNTTGTTTITSGATLDLNGQSTGETIASISGTGVGGNGALVNSNTSVAASVTQDIVNPGSLTIGGAGDITLTRIRSVGVFTVTKTGGGTLTTNGSSHNNLSAWDIQAGKVVFANTSGLAADRGVALNGGTLQLSGSNSNLVNDGQLFTINSGTFDLNGKSEAVASIGGNGGIVTNTNATTATLYVGGGVGGSSSANYGGVIQDGAGQLNLTKDGTGIQTLSGENTYTGLTTISNGTLALAATGSIDDTSGVRLGATGVFDVSAKTGGYAVSNLTGSGDVIGALTVTTELAAGFSAGTIDFSDDLTLGSSSAYAFELIGGTTGLNSADLVNVAGDLTISLATLNLAQLGTYTPNDKFTLFAYAGALNGNFAGLANAAEFTGAGGLWKINYFDTSAGTNGGTGTSFVTITAVPEPRAALLGGLGLLALLRRRRK